MPKVKKKYGGNPLLVAKGLKMASKSKMAQDLLDKTGDLVKGANDINGVMNNMKGTNDMMNNWFSTNVMMNNMKGANDMKDANDMINNMKGANDMKDANDMINNMKGVMNNPEGANNMTNDLLNSIDKTGQASKNLSNVNDVKNVLGEYTTSNAFDSEHKNRIPGTKTGLKGDQGAGPSLKQSKHPEDYNKDTSFHIILAVALKGIVRYFWDLFVMTVRSTYRLFTDLILIPFFIFLPYVFDVLAVILILILLILVIIYFVSGGKKRQKGNMFDNMLGGFSMLIMPNISGYVKDTADDFKDNANDFTGGVFDVFSSIGNTINDTIFKTFLRFFILNPGIDDINENDKSVRLQRKEGRCDNRTHIESKDGRYCYDQLDKKDIEWANTTIDYKLLKSKDMKTSGKNTHYDYYIPNCKGSGLFTKEYIASCKDSRRTKFICKI